MNRRRHYRAFDEEAYDDAMARLEKAKAKTKANIETNWNEYILSRK